MGRGRAASVVSKVYDPILLPPDLRDDNSPVSVDTGEFWIEVYGEVVRLAPASAGLFFVDDLLQNLL